jgi:hypothetical protein
LAGQIVDPLLVIAFVKRRCPSATGRLAPLRVEEASRGCIEIP